MQKHERICVQLAREILEPNGFRVTTENGGRAKLVIRVEGQGIRDRKTVSSSPSDSKFDENHTTQWARRLLKRVLP